MHKGTLAEHLLTPVTGAPRAGEIVGDLLETVPSTGIFWFSILRIALAYTWRWIVAVPAAMFSVMLIGIPYTRILQPQLTSVVATHSQQLVSDRAFHLSGYALLPSIVLASIAFLSLVRYGWRSPITRMAAATTVPLALSSFALCAHMLSVGIGLMAATVAIATVSAIRNARATAAVLSTAIAFAALFCVWAIGISICVGITFWRLGAASTFLPFVAFALWVSLYTAEAFILVRTSRWLRVA